MPVAGTELYFALTKYVTFISELFKNNAKLMIKSFRHGR